MSAEPGDALSQAIVSGNPGLAGKVHLVNGRPWCDGVNHTTMCDPRFEAPGLRARGATACLSHVHLDADGTETRPVTLGCAGMWPTRERAAADATDPEMAGRLANGQQWVVCGLVPLEDGKHD